MTVAKRAFDLLGSGLGLVLLLPVFAGIAAIVAVADGRPVFYRQERVGRGGRPFQLWKFRTMVPNADRLGGPLTVGDDPRITPVGRKLRAVKLDELPQLINVFMGDMSLVGPRPEVPGFVALYSDQERQVLDLTPGITDPASIRYRSENEELADETDPETAYVERIMREKLQVNLAYASRATVWRDFLVILDTFRSLIHRGA